ncbi:MAG: hypothetical protein HKN33_07290 [Pyrinomonadaceae bacterium]|nr:hypothetical protein [Pyrinomonadaceae bacterium]
MKKALILISVCLLCLVPGVSGQPENGDENQAAIDFPEVEGWIKGEVKKYSPAELGYSIGYRSNIGGIVTVYVYDKGLKGIPDGPYSNQVSTEIITAKNEIRSLLERGVYGAARFTKFQYRKLGSETGMFMVAQLDVELVREGRTYYSEILMTGLEGKFVKIRATRAPGIEGLENKAIFNLYEALDSFFSGKKDEFLKNRAKVSGTAIR